MFMAFEKAMYQLCLLIVVPATLSRHDIRVQLVEASKSHCMLSDMRVIVILSLHTLLFNSISRYSKS